MSEVIQVDIPFDNWQAYNTIYYKSVIRNLTNRWQEYLRFDNLVFLFDNRCPFHAVFPAQIYK